MQTIVKIVRRIARGIAITVLCCFVFCSLFLVGAGAVRLWDAVEYAPEVITAVCGLAFLYWMGD